MIKGFLHIFILIAIATGKTRLRSVKPLQKSRVLPGQPTANQNPYSGYALPPGTNNHFLAQKILFFPPFSSSHFPKENIRRDEKYWLRC